MGSEAQHKELILCTLVDCNSTAQITLHDNPPNFGWAGHADCIIALQELSPSGNHG